MNAQKLQCSGQVQLLVNDRDHQVSGDGNPDLGLHGIETRAEVMFDTQVHFDPAEEQLDAPPQTINQGHCQRRDFEMIGQKAPVPPRLGIEVMHLPQPHRKGHARFDQSGFPNLVAANAGGRLHWPRALAGEAQIVSGAGDEKCSRLEGEFVEPANVVLTGVGDVNVGGNRATQIDLGVDFDARFGAAKVGSRKKCERKIDGRGVQSIDRIFQPQSKVFSGIECSGLAHEFFHQVLPQLPVPLLVGVRQGQFGHRLAKAQMIKLFRLGVQTGGDVPQPLAPSQLGEDHTDELLATPEMSDPRFGIVAFHQTGKRLAIDQIQDLRKNVATGIHAPEACAARLKFQMRDILFHVQAAQK